MKKLIIYTILCILPMYSFGQLGKKKPSVNKTNSPAQLNISFEKLRQHQAGTSNTFDIPFYPKSFGTMLASGPGARIKAYSITGLPVWIEGKLMDIPVNNRQDVSTTALEFIHVNQATFSIKNAKEEFRITNTSSDDIGNVHVRMQQEYKGIEVWNSEVMVHTREGDPYLFNGRYIPTPVYLNTNPTISLDKAIEIAKNHRPVQEFTGDQLKLLAGSPISGRLVIFTQIDKTGRGHLAYLIEMHPNLIAQYQIFIDAHDGSILDEIKASCAIHFQGDHSCNVNDISVNFVGHESKFESLIGPPPLDGPATATATDLNNVPRTLNTYLKNGNYYLIDASRGMWAGGTLPDDPKGAIWTVDAKNVSPENDNFNIFHVTSSNNTWNAKGAVSAHYNGGIAYEYFKNTFGRNSINGSGGTIISVINVSENDGSGMDNAFWNGKAMFYGNGAQSFKPLAGGLDVAGHEMSHGVIQATANLTYQGESGALNESFADIFGVLIDRDDYKIGEDVVKSGVFPGGALRDMSNPHNGGSKLGDRGWQPNHMNEKYTGSQDNGGVHINSGIVNFAFYKIASKIGKDEAEKIYYAALTKYLTKSSQFIDCRNSVIQAAKDIYGTGSQNISIIENAFAEVGIGSGSGTPEQPDYGTNPGQDYLLFASSDLNQIKLVNFSSGSATTLNHDKGLASKISVSDDGTLAVFVGKDNALYYIQFNWSAGNYNIGILDNQNQWRNAAISKDGLRLAALLDIEEPVIYVFNLESDTYKAFELYNPTTSSGSIFTNDVKYADALEFDHSGEYLMYDALSSLGFFGTEYWDIGFLNVWNNSTSNFAEGYIEKLFSSLPDGVSVGNAVFSKNSPSIIAFDYFEDGSSTVNELLGANIETGELNVLFENSVLGFPCFSRDDKNIIFNANDNNGISVIAIIPLEDDKISPALGASILVNNSTLGTWFANGKRVINSTQQYNALEDLVTIFPNPATNIISVRWNSNHGISGTINVYDTQSKKLFSKNVSLQSGDNLYTIPVDNLIPGAYYIELIKGNQSKSISIIKK